MGKKCITALQSYNLTMAVQNINIVEDLRARNQAQSSRSY